MASLIIEHANGTRERQALGTAAQTIGRDEVCDVIIDDLKASRRHARLAQDKGGGYYIEDLGSKNGTLVNGQRLTRQRLHDGDQIEIGTTILVFRERDEVSADTQVVVGDEVRGTVATSVAGRAEKLRLSQHRLELLSELGERLIRLQSRADLLNTVMDICFETLRFERGLIAMKNRPGTAPEWPVVRNLSTDRTTGQLTISRTILQRAMEDGERTIINDAQSADFDPTVSIAANRIRSALCVPLEFEDEILGVIYGDRTSSTTVYEREDVDFLAALARQASIGIANSRLLEENRKWAVLENELVVARQIQTGLFPADFVATPRLEIRTHNEPGRQVSGDYYDVVELRGGRTAVLIADVSGKGVSAAMLMANLQAAVRVTLPGAEDLAGVVQRWNQLLCDNTDVSQFITLLLLVADPAARKIEYVNAGHLLPIWLEATGASRDLSSAGSLPLGIERDEEYEVQQADWGDRPTTLVMYTDGVTEAMDEQGELFGTERMLQTLAEHADALPQVLISALCTSVKKFCGRAPQADDITLVALRMS